MIRVLSSESLINALIVGPRNHEWIDSSDLELPQSLDAQLACFMMYEGCVREREIERLVGHMIAVCNATYKSAFEVATS